MCPPGTALVERCAELGEEGAEMRRDAPRCAELGEEGAEMRRDAPRCAELGEDGGGGRGQRVPCFAKLPLASEPPVTNSARGNVAKRYLG